MGAVIRGSSFMASPNSFLPYFAIHPSPFYNSPIFYRLSAPSSLALPHPLVRWTAFTHTRLYKEKNAQLDVTKKNLSSRNIPSPVWF